MYTCFSFHTDGQKGEMRKCEELCDVLCHGIIPLSKIHSGRHIEAGKIFHYIKNGSFLNLKLITYFCIKLKRKFFFIVDNELIAKDVCKSGYNIQVNSDEIERQSEVLRKAENGT